MLNPQGCGFGVVRKPINKRYVEKHTGIRTQILDADASFFVYSRHYPLSCRGAVGYKTGVFPQRPAGSFLFMIFLTPRPPCPWNNGGFIMRKIIVFLLLCLIGRPVWTATLQGYGEVEGCYSHPDKTVPICDGLEETIGVQYCYVPALGCNVPIKVEGAVSFRVASKWAEMQETLDVLSLDDFPYGFVEGGAYVYCKMTYPYEGFYVAYYPGYSFEVPFDDARYCSALYRKDDNYSCYQDKNEPDKSDSDDWCYDDGYEGGIFESSEDEELFLSALFATEMPPETPCTIGISKLMVSTGDSFQLYAEQYTEHALVVQYNDEKCYLKLEEGQGGLNVMANGIIYHVIE